MTLHRPHLRPIRLPGLPGRTVRSRLTWLYGSLFLACGVVLLVITGVLWNNATSRTVTALSPVPKQVFAIAGIGGQFNAGPHVTRTGHRPPAKGLTATVRPAVQRAQVTAKLRVLTGEQHWADLRDLLFYSGIAVAIAALLALGLGWLTAGRVLRPLRSMTSAVRDMSAHNLHERLAVEGPDDELTRLGSTFDELLGRLERSFQSQRMFAANASHELRTPLTTMRAAIDVALAKPEPVPPETVRLATRLRRELDQVDRLLESLFALARAQTGSKESAAQSLDTLVSAAVGRREGTIRRERLTVEKSECGAATVAGDAALLERMVENVVDNAVRHNQRGGWVRLSCEVENGTAVLTVENGGPVLDQEAVDRLARPFRRLGPQRTGSGPGGGHGLGLSIVDAIAAAHDGRLSLAARSAGGLCVRIELPVHLHELVGAPA